MSIDNIEHRGSQITKCNLLLNLAFLAWRGTIPTHAPVVAIAQVYNCFTEGLNTIDLKEAKILLDALAS
jgi:hypothetical protein